MQALFPDWLTTTHDDLDALFSPLSCKLKLTILVRNPEFSSPISGEAADDPGTTSVEHITKISLLSDLLANPAWQEVTNSFYSFQNWNAAATQSKQVSLTSPTVGVSRLVTVEETTFNYWPVTNGKPVLATGFVLSIDRVGHAHHGKVVMILRPETPIYLTGEDEDINCRIGAITHFFNYIEANLTDATQGWDFGIGDVSIVVPTIDWETARCAHIWIDPQRINYVINPSFRYADIGWRTNATTFVQVSASGDPLDGGGIRRDGAASCVRLAGATPLVLESNLFPTNANTEMWSVSAMVAGTGRARVGIVFFQPSMDPQQAIYLHTQWVTLSSSSASESSFQRLYQSFPIPDSAKEGLVRIEFDGTQCWVDEVLAAPEDGPGTYFDASWPLGQPGDYSWYGGATGWNDRSYSLFYNNRDNLQSLLFGYLEDDPLDGQPARYNGEAQNWVPEGVNIVPHWNDVFSTRVHTWMDDVIVPPVDYTPAYKNVVTSLPVTAYGPIAEAQAGSSTGKVN